jgi:gluconolactonase
MARFEVMAEGLASPEGPVTMPDGSVVLVEQRIGQISRLWPDGRKHCVAVTGGGPNGLAFGADGSLYCVNNGGFDPWTDAKGNHYGHSVSDNFFGGWIERIDIETGDVAVLYRSGDFGCTIRGPNDIVVDEAGGLWFTDHGKMNFSSRTSDIVGMFYAKADGSHLEEAAWPLHNTNGIGLSPDGKRLYAAETYTCRLLAFDLAGPGEIAQGASPFGPAVPLYRGRPAQAFDSLAVEANGNVCVATIGPPGQEGISVISPEGELVELVNTGEMVTTNICFGGADMMDAYVTAGGKLLKTRWARSGLQLNFQPR